MLSCLRVTGCANVATGQGGDAVVAACYCGTTPFASCQSANANGPCKAAFERSLETDDKQLMIETLADNTFGGAQAFFRAGCDHAHCSTASCFSQNP
jgi:hypothetical protein